MLFLMILPVFKFYTNSSIYGGVHANSSYCMYSTQSGECFEDIHIELMLPVFKLNTYHLLVPQTLESIQLKVPNNRPLKFDSI